MCSAAMSVVEPVWVSSLWLGIYTCQFVVGCRKVVDIAVARDACLRRQIK